LPRSFFGSLSVRTAIPRNNVLLLGAITLTGCFVLSFDRGAELLNFGAFIAFMGVNLAALLHNRQTSSERKFRAGLIPLLGFLICAFIWLNLARIAQIIGVLWIVAGLAVYWAMHHSKRDRENTLS
jgi:hypothetical protein